MYHREIGETRLFKQVLKARKACSSKLGGCTTVKHSVMTGLVLTVLIVGLHSFSGSTMVVIGGVLTIAIADAFLDALGIYVSEEGENVHTAREIWESTLVTFAAKFLFALTFLVPVLIFDLSTAILVSTVWGLFTLAILSRTIAQATNYNPSKVVAKYVAIAVIVVVLTHYLGDVISAAFG